MTLIEQISADIAAAMKAKESGRLAALRMAKAALMNQEVQKGRPLDEGESLQVMTSLIKQRRDSIEQFLKDVFWDGLDFLVVDMPPGTGDIAISMSQFLPRAQVLLVTTPQPTAQRVARRAALMAAEVDQEVIGVVENMSWFTGDDGTRYELFGAGGGRALAEELGVDLMAQVPLIPEMGRGADTGDPVYVATPGSEVEKAFETLAGAVIEKRPRVRTNPALVIR